MKYKSKKLIILEANIDDMNPQGYEPLMGSLFEAGALDVTLCPVMMKKNRPGTLVSALCPPDKREKILKIFFEGSTTLGVRSYEVERFELEREFKKVKTPYGLVTVKIGKDPSGKILNSAPEYESCRKIARQKRVPIKQVYQAALKASHY